MEIKIVKNEKNVEIIRVGGDGNKKGLSKLSSDKKSEMKIGKISNRVLERIGGLEKFMKRFNRLYPKFKFTMVDTNAPAPVVPAPEAPVVPAPEAPVVPAPVSNG